MTLSNRQRKKLRKQKTCYSKRAYKSAQEAKKADSALCPYHCPVCFKWHNTSVPDMDEVDRIMRQYK